MSRIEQGADVFSRVVQALNITEQGVEERKAFLEIDQTDANLLKMLAEPIANAYE